MIITKSERKILNYVYKHKSVSYKLLSHKFHKHPNLPDTIHSLVYNQYLLQVGGSKDQYGEPIPISPESQFQINSLGISEVEKYQWFDMQYVFTSLIVPVIVGVTSSLITALLLALLS